MQKIEWAKRFSDEETADLILKYALMTCEERNFIIVDKPQKIKHEGDWIVTFSFSQRLV